ncbi:MAG: hypothetical protein ACJATI_005009 [Halioglobus sp.]|jgi:hypothetical protein
MQKHLFMTPTQASENLSIKSKSAIIDFATCISIVKLTFFLNVNYENSSSK